VWRGLAFLYSPGKDAITISEVIVHVLREVKLPVFSYAINPLKVDLCKTPACKVMEEMWFFNFTGTANAPIQAHAAAGGC
jgi:hypothetical protein